MIALSQKKHY